jgi:hypothetical protein
LIYLGHRPFSASFYSQGQALVEKTPEALIKRLAIAPAYVAIRTSDLDYMPPALMRGLERLSAQGYFTLFRTKDAPVEAPALPASK